MKRRSAISSAKAAVAGCLIFAMALFGAIPGYAEETPQLTKGDVSPLAVGIIGMIVGEFMVITSLPHEYVHATVNTNLLPGNLNLYDDTWEKRPGVSMSGVNLDGDLGGDDWPVNLLVNYGSFAGVSANDRENLIHDTISYSSIGARKYFNLQYGIRPYVGLAASFLTMERKRNLPLNPEEDYVYLRYGDVEYSQGYMLNTGVNWRMGIYNIGMDWRYMSARPFPSGKDADNYQLSFVFGVGMN